MKVDPMARALALASRGGERGEVPVGCVIVDAFGREVAAAHNAMRQWRDPTAHAEMIAIRKACAVRGPYLDGCVAWVTLEPCPMCAAALSLARVSQINFAAPDAKSGALENGFALYGTSVCHFHPEVQSGFRAEESARMLKDFFSQLRKRSIPGQ